MARDEQGHLYHIEEQRNLSKSDMYRFAAYHFLGAKQWGHKITDIVLASGDVYSGEKTIITDSGKYTPVVIDFTQKDGRKRLDEIRRAVQEETFDSWLELVFLPLYGTETGTARSQMAEEVLHFEKELFYAEKIPVILLAATLIMCNKMIDKERIKELWEVIKMLDVLEVAKEKGIEEGKVIGIEEGKILGIEEGKVLGIEEGKNLGTREATRKMVLSALYEKFGVMPPRISEKIREIQNQDTLESLFREVFRCADMRAFKESLERLE